MAFKQGEKLIVVHFGELWLKGRNRGDYIRCLERNIRGQLRDEDCRLERHFDRLILRLGKRSKTDSIAGKLRRIFGISAFEVALTAKPTLASITSASKKMLAEKPMPKSVKINSHRAYKQLPFDSMDVVKRVMEAAEKLGIEPMTKGYERELTISITKEAAFLSMDREKGLGGLPVGSSGKAVVLISGGIDSPVAAWYAMKRGLVPVYVHLHGFQNAAEAENGKVPRIINLLAAYCPHYSAYLVPSHIFQAGSFKYGRNELILLKAFMLRLAEAVAEKEGAKVIYTGESLGQVASQTPENLAAEQYGVELPVLRPLIGYDKEEIVRVAKAIGTFEESTKPYKDVCSINARKPKLRAAREEIAKALSAMKISSVLRRSLRLSSTISA